MATSGKAYGSRSSHGRLSARLGGPELVTQTKPVFLLNLVANRSGIGATCCLLPGRPLEGQTNLFELSGPASIACLLPHSAGLECVGLLE